MAGPGRPRYFEGQLLTVADFADEQAYFLDKLRRHNRCLHGAGICDGLKVSLDAGGAGKVRVSPGIAIDCLGQEICVPALAGASPPSAGGTVYLILRYAERTTASVPVPGSPRGNELQASRIEEAYALAFDAADPFVGHRSRGGFRRACGADHGVPIARLRRRGGRWQVDARYRPPGAG